MRQYRHVKITLTYSTVSIAFSYVPNISAVPTQATCSALSDRHNEQLDL